MRSRLVASVALLSLWPTRADAHLVTTGLGPIYDGISHLFVSPDDLLAVVTMGLLAGLNGAATGRRVLFLLPVAWLGSGAAALVLGPLPVPGMTAAVSLLTLGGLTALDRRLPLEVVGALALTFGAAHGSLNAMAIAAGQHDGLSLLGIVAAIFVMVAISGALAVTFRATAARIVIRVAGSWVAAIGLLMLGWSLRHVV